jgi:hypothetical protein
MNDNLRYITFHNDPGHGWLEVSVEEAREAERVTGEKISPYSYISRGIAFLEEDCDAGIFLRYLDKLRVTYKLYDYYTDHCSPIRNYNSYC